ncbi:hypothetical protein FI667_g12342, partial [Globisporangium splendens]
MILGSDGGRIHSPTSDQAACVRHAPTWGGDDLFGKETNVGCLSAVIDNTPALVVPQQPLHARSTFCVLVRLHLCVKRNIQYEKERPLATRSEITGSNPRRDRPGPSQGPNT